MEEVALNTLPLSGYAGKSFGCVCGKRHCIETHDIIFGVGAIEGLKVAVEGIIPPLSSVLIIFDEFGEDARVAATRMLAGAGYRISSHKILHKGCPIKLARAVAVREDTRLIFAAGGGEATEVAKAVCLQKELPLVVLATQPSYIMYLAPFIYEGEGVVAPIRCASPRVVVTDIDWLSDCTHEHLASGFGQIASKIIALFDRNLSRVIESASHCAFVEEQGMAIIDTLIEKLDGLISPLATIAAIIMEQGMRFSALLQLEEDYSLVTGGEEQVASCLELLQKAEQVRGRLSGENRFIIATILSKLYLHTLEGLASIGFVAPPDNNLRAELVEEYLAVSQSQILNRLQPSSHQVQKIHQYKLGEFREDLLSAMRLYHKKLARASKIFKRLYLDCGYSLLGYLDYADLRLALALAPDIKQGFSLLTLLKNMGILDHHL